MNVLIIEDESRSALRLKKLIIELDESIVVLGVCESIVETCEWLESNSAPNLIFSDIQLADGLSFEIFERQNVSAPVVFTTAYDHYAIRAFKSNGIDYLLKPIDPEELAIALKKAKKSNYVVAGPRVDWAGELAKAISAESKSFRSRFLLKMGEKYKSVESGELIAIEGRDKSTWVLTADGRSYPIDDALENLEKELNPKDFFRINRKYIIRVGAIRSMESWPNSRVKLSLDGLDADDLIVSRDRTAAFKKWLDR